MQFPEAFITQTKKLLGNEWTAFEQALNEESPVSIRLNPIKMKPDSLCDTMSISEPVPWATDGYYLDSRPIFTLDPSFHAGCYYVQEASSMLLEHFVRNYFPQPAKVLDLCAAPGGKSTHISALLPEASLLVANEVIRSRAVTLAENLIKWGNPNMIVTNNDPSDIGRSLPCFFDVIVTDLPCSGEGMFRKDPKAIAEWSENNVRLCANRQRRIVADIWPALNPGGILIYSTCTFNREENEENLDWICKEFDAELLEEPRRMMLHQIKGEGFFIAGIRKKGEKVSGEITGFQYATPAMTRKAHQVIATPPFADFISSHTNYTYISVNNSWIAIPSIHFQDYLQIRNSLRILFAGVALGEIKGENIVPAHGLAISNALSETAFPCWEVDKKTALDYLRREIFRNFPVELPKGYILTKYKRQALGFVKNIGMRVNNLYPQEWRIRMFAHFIDV